MEKARIAGRARSALVVALLPVLILALAGCGHGKLSARQAAQKLRGYLGPGYRVQCDPASGRYWDYACTVAPPSGSNDKPYKMKVQVDSHEILEKANCNAPRTGSPIHC
jgi:hypothetical protein